MKRFLLIIVAVWLCGSSIVYAYSSAETLCTRPKVALVLSGGGARGAAHVGVIRLIEELHIPIDYVVGTSMGAIVGALYAIGYTANEMDSLMMTQDWKMLLSNDLPRYNQPYAQRMARKRYQVNIPYDKGVFTENSSYYRDAGIKVRRTSLQTFPKVLARPGLIDGANLMNKFVHLTSVYLDSISYDALPRAFACVATDLVTGREVVLRSGVLAESIRASMAIPGVFYPVYQGDQVLVDGGVVNNYPVDVAKQMGADVIIGVEVNSATIDARDLQSFASIFERLIGTLGSDIHEQNVADTDILIRPQVREFPVMGFDTTNLRQLIDIGYRTAKLRMTQLEMLSVNNSRTQSYYLENEEESVPAINYENVHSTQKRSLSPDSSVSVSHLSLGLRLDSEDAAAALLNISRKSPTLSGFKGDLTTRIGSHPWIAVHLAYAKSHWPQVNFAAKYSYTNISHSYNKNKAFSYHLCSSDIYLSHLVSKDFDLRAGFRYDNYWERIYPFTYSSRQSYTTLYALWQNDLFNTAYTPTKGYAYSIEVSYLMEERTKRGSNFWVLRGEASVAIPLGSATTLTPSFYVRSLFGEAIPMFYSNVIGGYLPGRFLSQQIPFVGFTRCEFVGPYLVQSNIALQQRLIADVYITMLANYAYIREKLSSDSQGQNALGVSLQLSYDTTIGPLMLSCHWNSLYHRFGAYFCFGFEF